MRYLFVALMALLLTVLAACGGGGSSATPPADNNTPPADNNNTTPPVDNNDNNPVDTSSYGITIQGDKAVVSYTLHTPSNGEEEMSDTVSFEMPLADLDELNKESNALVNFDREKMRETINATSLFLYERQQSAKTFGRPAEYGLPSGITWPNTFLWNSDANAGNTFYRNVQSVTWLGLLTAAELYTLRDGSNNIINGDIKTDLESFWDRTPGSKGFGGWIFDYCIANNDGDESTKLDRAYSYDIILLSRMANVYNNPQYDFMAQQLMATITADYPNGGDFAAHMASTRQSLSLWDVSSYIWAASLTYEYDWAEEVIAYMYDNPGEWDGVGSWDYTNLGWAFIPTALAELAQYHNLSGKAQWFYNEGIARTTGLDFRHSSYGYWGSEDDGRLWDSTQISGYGLSTMGFVDQYNYNGSNQNVLDAADGCLEWFNAKVLPMSDGFDLDFDGNIDTGAIRSYYRGNLLAGEAFYYEPISEALWGMVVATEQFSRYPDVPLE